MKDVMKKINVVGLGKLGACTAMCFADAGFEVVSLEKDFDIKGKANRGEATVEEPGLQELFDKNMDKFRATTVPYEAIVNTDISFIIVPTPSNYSDRFNNMYVEEVLNSFSFFLEKKEKRHIFVVVSTVMPGSMRKFIGLIEKKSGKKYPKDFGLVYNPEFVAIGSVIKDFKNPDMLLFGGIQEDIDEVFKIYAQAVDNEPRIARMSFEEAEITKLSLNTFLTMKIAYANILGDICDAFHSDVDKVSEAIGMDSRISPKLLKAGMSFGGTCFPRDVRALQSLVNSIGCDYRLPEIVEECNYLKEKYIAMEAIKGFPSVVNIIGAAYKDNVPVIEESPSIRIARLIDNAGISVKLFDKKVKELAQFELSDNFEDSVDHGVTIILAYPDENLARTIWLKATQEKYCLKIIDPWRLLKNYHNPLIEKVSLGSWA